MGSNSDLGQPFCPRQKRVFGFGDVATTFALKKNSDSESKHLVYRFCNVSQRELIPNTNICVLNFKGDCRA